MQWIPNHNIFPNEVISPPKNPTKRAILSAIIRIYDLLGFLSPIVFYAKTILQGMWIFQYGWDVIGPHELSSRWYRFLYQLAFLNQMRIPSKIVHLETVSSMIIGFCDTSQTGFYAVLYLTYKTPSDNYQHLLKVKIKLAPIKPTFTTFRCLPFELVLQVKREANEHAEHIRITFLYQLRARLRMAALSTAMTLHICCSPRGFNFGHYSQV